PGGHWAGHGRNDVVWLIPGAASSCRSTAPAWDKVVTTEDKHARPLTRATGRAGRCPGWCERGDSNPHALRHWNLNPGRLPIPPLSRCRPPARPVAAILRASAKGTPRPPHRGQEKSTWREPGASVLVGRQGFEPWTY